MSSTKEEPRIIEPWEDLGPVEYANGPIVYVMAWAAGLMLTGAIGIAILFIIAGEKSVTIGAHLVMALSFLVGGGVVGGLVDSPARTKALPPVLVTLLGILLPALVILYFVSGQQSLVLGVTGTLASVAGVFIGRKIARVARFRSA